MKRSKKIFVIVAVLFIAAIFVVGYDISRKTSFPGSKKYLKESIAPSEADSVVQEQKLDTLTIEQHGQ
ncbi:hypothetical protein [Roseivirga pacifica]|uniref:hypothetical protein n=1 Tax=Roseivirga pacifica TaxID=1267423 RepID=UPI00209512B0|nr:hypothetical protein [Roseivirga pacifica]MCO6358430.1 hypothetical protein [Roseivirga pacifica]MCO6368985.1 hypothetical protein [Roseivirga pacifica]MCO6372311.1 hypothetical protein [Roseivirga pacifica]MCO6374161.1 hypothetical protein [Roseivirga pacifica]MCO6381042.1 hypothetical protein [Roseivirga pacifica]